MVTSTPSGNPTSAVSPDDASDDDDMVVRLDDRRAIDRELVGGKAAALARATAESLAVLPGVVLTTRFSCRVDAGGRFDEPDSALRPWLRDAADELQTYERLVARSSSVSEDDAESSAAGQYESVVGIDGIGELVDAVAVVLASRSRAGTPDEPIAVVVQPLLEVRVGGVAFGIDPVTGRTDQRVVTASSHGPDALVSGEVEGARYVVDDDGDSVEAEREDQGPLGEGELSDIVALVDRAGEVFEGPQDIEWAIDHDDTLWLLQSRPVTTEVRGRPMGPVYGPGPVAETFPDELSRFEADLWVPPLDQAVHEAMRIVGSVAASNLEGPAFVIVCDGRVAIDLERTRGVGDDAPWHDRINPAQIARRLRSAWRVGRLRAALPKLAERLVERVDEDLAVFPDPDGLSNQQLAGAVGRGRLALQAVHAHEVLMGLLVDTRGSRLTGTSVALRLLAEGRREGLSDPEIISRSPIVLALTGPKVGAGTRLPQELPDLAPGTHPPDHSTPEHTAAVHREALRIRVRWLQEMMAVAAWTLAVRLERGGVLDDAADIHLLDFEELTAVGAGRALITRDVRPHHRDSDPSAPLPARFQLSDRQRPVAVARDDAAGEGTGAGGGRGQGRVTHDADGALEGRVLVTAVLDPALGPKLVELAGIVCETGSVLSHLAILAREHGTPLVVGYGGALSNIPEGAVACVDGENGTVEVLDRDPDQEVER